MRINKERMAEVKKYADKKLQDDIKNNPKVYEECINDLKKIQKTLSEMDLDNLDDDVVKAAADVAESSFYEALASGLKREDIAFFEEFADALIEKYKKMHKKAIKEGTLWTEEDWKELEKDMENLKNELEEMKKDLNDFE